MSDVGNNLAGTGQALDSSLNTIFAEFRMLRDEMGVMRKLATRSDLAPHQGTTKNILNYGRLQAFDLEDGMDMVQHQTLSDTNTAYTPAEVGLQVILPKSTLRRVADPDLLRRTGQMMANAYDLKEDADGCAQLVNFTPIVGAANTVISVGYVGAAGAVLRIGNNRANPEPAPEPWVGVLHPNQMAILAARLIPLNASSAGGTAPAAGVLGDQPTPGRSAMSDEIIRRGPSAAGTLWNMTMYSDANIPVDVNDDASGAFFSKQALMYISEVEPIMEPDEQDKSLRAIELNLWGSYVWGIYRAGAYGVEALFDATTPTS
jgi:hypothetical protein